MDGEMIRKDTQDEILDLIEILSCLRHRNVCKPRERMALDIVIKDLHQKALNGDEVSKKNMKLHDFLKRLNDIYYRLTVIEEKVNKSTTSKASAKKCKHHYFGKLHIDPSTSFITPANRVNYNYKDSTVKNGLNPKENRRRWCYALAIMNS